MEIFLVRQDHNDKKFALPHQTCHRKKFIASKIEAISREKTLTALKNASAAALD